MGLKEKREEIEIWSLNESGTLGWGEHPTEVLGIAGCRHCQNHDKAGRNQEE